ncbi:MAG: hypothetical protein J6C64_08600 [Lachnospiraceae bacterium]|nr:hypothetical protein [Lachnospiraceae bacterium]
MNEEYNKKGIDLKRMYLRFQTKAWLLLMLTMAGAVVGGIAYQVARATRMPVAYEAVSKLYISFGADESGEIYQYYNGYTWNDLLDADPILNRIMEYVPEGISREEVAAATKAEILSDIRLLTITVEGSTEKFVREVQAAAESGLTAYADDSEEIKRIKVIRTDEPYRVFWDDKTVTACVTGAVIFAVISCLFMAFFYVLDEAIYTQEDVERKYPYKALGLIAKSQKGLQPYARELRANITYVLGDIRSFALIDMENHCEIRKEEVERLLNIDKYDFIGGDGEAGGLTWSIPKSNDDEDEEKEGEWKAIPFNGDALAEEECIRIRELGGAIILIPFGEDVGRKTRRVLSLLKNQDCKVLGMVVSQADEEFLNRYYG